MNGDGPYLRQGKWIFPTDRCTAATLYHGAMAMIAPRCHDGKDFPCGFIDSKTHIHPPRNNALKSTAELRDAMHDAERSARIADRHLPEAPSLRRV